MIKLTIADRCRIYEAIMNGTIIAAGPMNEDGSYTGPFNINAPFEFRGLKMDKGDTITFDGLTFV